MEGDPAVTLKQQVEAIIRSGMAAWMSAHALISPRPSGPPESACMRSSSEEPRHGVKLFSPPLLPCVSQSPLCSSAAPEAWSCYFTISVLTVLRLPSPRTFLLFSSDEFLF